MAAKGLLSKGTPVWVPTEGGGGWQRGVVIDWQAEGATCRVALDFGPRVMALTESLEPANPALLDGVSDLVRLSNLNEPSILEVLRQRSSSDRPYSSAGPNVLVAVNPFKELPLYGPDTMRSYSQRSSREDVGSYEPHIFLTADQAYKQMVATNQSQSILITGESGSGKTETAKLAMSYIAVQAGGIGMEAGVLEATNLILEAFGNACTLHNRNSSRFGKLIELYFDHRSQLIGGRIHSYLLEKSRVAHVSRGERGFHIFAQLCRGVVEEERTHYLLPSAANLDRFFRYLSSISIPGVDDAVEFAQTKAALAKVGIGSEQQASLWRILAAILWLGNVCFCLVHDDAVTVDEASMPAVRAAAALLQCGEAPLLHTLTKRKLVAGNGELITRELNMEAAVENRDALAKALYATLFTWLVGQINAALAVGKKQSSTTTLSILDIYGFESFACNSFEQLCINLANERLQQQFNAHMFRLEQEEYAREGIPWSYIDFVDNQDCVELLDARPPAGVGILSLLDEECLMPRGSDSTFAAKLAQQHAAHPRFSYNTKAPGNDFTVRHYAAPVTYSTAKFLDKNRDTLSKDLVALLRTSSAPLVQHLAAAMERGQERRGSQTVGARFRDQLRDLIQRLDATSLHFVRCIKPNSLQVAGTFDSALINHQLACCGILEVAQIAAAGYPTRFLQYQFAERYKVLLPELAPGSLPVGASALGVCKQLLAHFDVDASQYQIGSTRIFFRAGVLARLEDAVSRMQRSALNIQSTWRMARCRRAFLLARSAAVAIQARWRGHCARALLAQMLRQHHAAARIQAAARGCVQRRRYQRAMQCVVVIQMAWRRHVVKGRVAVRLAQRHEAEAELKAVEEAQRRQDETFEAIQRDYGVNAGEIRRVLQLWQDCGQAFMQWHQQPSRSASCQAATVAADDSGLLLEAAAVNVDMQQMQQRLEGLQVYCHKLECHADNLREENQLLHRAVVTLQQAVDERADPAATAHCRAVLPSIISLPAVAAAVETGQLALGSRGCGRPPPLQPRFALHADASSSGAAANGALPGEQQEDDDSSISLMSLNDGDSFTTDSQSQGMAASLAAARAESSALVGALGRELDKKRTLLDDDAAFIREVGAGLSAAPGMDPGLELQRLVTRYKAWKKEFKERLGNTQRVIKQLGREERRAAGHASDASSFTQSGSGWAHLRSNSGVRDAASVASDDGSRTSRASRMLSHFKPRKG